MYVYIYIYMYMYFVLFVETLRHLTNYTGDMNKLPLYTFLARQEHITYLDNKSVCHPA